MIQIRLSVSQELRSVNPEGVRQAVEWWKPRGALMTRNEMVRQIGARTRTVGRTGFLRKSVTTRLLAQGFEVGPTATYAPFVDQPTRAHEIKPRRAKALAFPQAGGILSRSNNGNLRTRFIFGGRETKAGVVFAKSVRHPGTKGVFFIDATAAQIVGPVSGLLDRSLQMHIGTS